jgi:type I restriction enzyme, R subunit
MRPFTESVVEDATLAWLESLGYAVKHGPEIAPGNFSKQTDREAIVPADRRRQLVQKMH